jgi:hypothetical protein
MIRRKEMPPPLVLKAVTTQISVTLNKKTLTSRGADGPVPWIMVATAARMSTAVPVRTANTARGYCDMKKGTVPANISGKYTGQQYRSVEIANDE